jgi:hypothetical protein
LVSTGVVGRKVDLPFFSFIVNELSGFDDLFRCSTASRASEPMVNKIIKLKIKVAFAYGVLVLALEADAEVFLDGIVIIQRRWK